MERIKSSAELKNARPYFCKAKRQLQRCWNRHTRVPLQEGEGEEYFALIGKMLDKMSRPRRAEIYFQKRPGQDAAGFEAVIEKRLFQRAEA